MFTTPIGSALDRPPQKEMWVTEANPTGPDTDPLKTAFMRALEDLDPYIRDEHGNPLMIKGTEAPGD